MISESIALQFEYHLANISPRVLNQTTIRRLWKNFQKAEKVTLHGSDLYTIPTLKSSKTIIRHVGKANPQRKKLTRYLINSPSPFSIGLSLRSKSFLSHNSALSLYGLTDKLPQRIYVNMEQSEKYNENEITQEGIDRAFKNQVRQSNYIWAWKNYRFVLINGKNTGELGVIDFTLDRGEVLRVTNLERTLIDIVIRPVYAGGEKNIIEAYSRAKGKTTAERIISILQELDYSYPYHQSIGFLMEKTGFDKSEYNKFLNLGTEYDFYLAHGMKKTKYDSKWRLHYPQQLKF